ESGGAAADALTERRQHQRAILEQGDVRTVTGNAHRRVLSFTMQRRRSEFLFDARFADAQACADCAAEGSERTTVDKVVIFSVLVIEVDAAIAGALYHQVNPGELQAFGLVLVLAEYSTGTRIGLGKRGSNVEDDLRNFRAVA